MLSEFSKTLIYSYFTKWGWDRLAIPEGTVCPELVHEFYANIHSTNKDAGTLKSYVRGVSLEFSIFDIYNFLLIQPLNPEFVGFPYP